MCMSIQDRRLTDMHLIQLYKGCFAKLVSDQAGYDLKDAKFIIPKGTVGLVTTDHFSQTVSKRPS